MWWMTQAQKTRFRLSAGASVQSTTGSRGVRIRGSNAGYIMFRGSVKGTGYPLHSPVSPSIPLPYVTMRHHISTGVYYCTTFLLLLLPQLYNSLWVLACSIIPLHGFLSCALCFQLFTPIFLKSSLTSSTQLNLGLPFGLVACGFHL